MKNDSITMEILRDYKLVHKRDFIIIIILILALIFVTYKYIQLSNDMQTVVTTDTIDIQDVNDITDSDIGIGR